MKIRTYDMSFDYANVGYKESTQHNTTQPNTTAISSRGGNVFPTTNSEGGIYLHVLEDR